jgi:hypothetical protein
VGRGAEGLEGNGAEGVTHEVTNSSRKPYVIPFEWGNAELGKGPWCGAVKFSPPRGGGGPLVGHPRPVDGPISFSRGVRLAAAVARIVCRACHAPALGDTCAAGPIASCAVPAGVPARQRRERCVSCIYIVGFDNVPEERSLICHLAAPRPRGRPRTLNFNSFIRPVPRDYWWWWWWWRRRQHAVHRALCR